MNVSERRWSEGLGAPSNKWKPPYIKSRASAPAPTLCAGAEKIGDDVGAFRHHSGFICSSMERAVMRLARMSLSVVLLLSLWHHGAQAARLSQRHGGAQAARILEELPPCKDVPGGIPGWDCNDPLPPSDEHHHRAYIDCWPSSPSKAQQPTLLMNHDAFVRVEGELPLCKDVPGGIKNWDCYDPPSTPLPPCDFKHQNLGIDCSTDSQKPRPPSAPKSRPRTPRAPKAKPSPPPAPKAKQGDLL